MPELSSEIDGVSVVGALENEGISADELIAKLPSLDPEEREMVINLVKKFAAVQERSRKQDSFLGFTKEVWPAFIQGSHHKKMAEAFERVAAGELKRLIINMPPRHTKSEFASYLLPAWFLGKDSKRKIIQASHTSELAVSFGRKVRNLVGSEEYRKIFPGVSLRQDSKAAGRWNTSEEGEYFAIGVGGAVTGKGADLLIIDDPHSEQEGQSGDSSIFDRVYEWYTSGPRQRLQPGGSIVIVMTRWSQRDLTGAILQASAERKGADEWEVIEFPAILPSGRSLWPGYWKLEELEKIKAELPAAKWSAQYQQDPTADEAAIVKREWWREWELEKPPFCEFIIQSWDTAFLKTERADYSACTTWGIFSHESGKGGAEVPNIILLDAFQKRMEFPELKQVAMIEWKKWEPDACIIESKAAGTPLIFELRQMGIPVSEYSPSRGNDKVARVNSVSDLFSSGVVWVPRKRFAEEVIEQFAGFPGAAAHDDLFDSSTQALIRFRQGGFIPLHSDLVEEFQPKKKAEYY